MTIKRTHGISLGAQRFALVAGGRDESRCRNGKNPEPGKRQKTRRVPTCPLHALLGNLIERKTCQLK